MNGICMEIKAPAGFTIFVLQVSFDEGGNLVIGETSTWSNEGLCSGGILDDTTKGTYDPSVGHGINAYIDN